MMLVLAQEAEANAGGGEGGGGAGAGGGLDLLGGLKPVQEVWMVVPWSQGNVRLLS